VRRTIFLLAAAAAMVAIILASTSPAFAQGKGPKLVSGVLQVPACNPGEGEISGNDTPATKSGVPDFGAVHGGEDRVGIAGCYVTLPPQVQPIEEGPVF
jgi:hypothetical protein